MSKLLRMTALARMVGYQFTEGEIEQMKDYPFYQVLEYLVEEEMNCSLIKTTPISRVMLLRKTEEGLTVVFPLVRCGWVEVLEKPLDWSSLSPTTLYHDYKNGRLVTMDKKLSETMKKPIKNCIFIRDATEEVFFVDCYHPYHIEALITPFINLTRRTRCGGFNKVPENGAKEMTSFLRDIGKAASITSDLLVEEEEEVLLMETENGSTPLYGFCQDL